MSDLEQRVIALASELAVEAHRVQTAAERGEAAQMARMMTDPRGKAFTLAMADRVFRSRDPRKQSERLDELVDQYGVPAYLGLGQRTMLRLGAAAAHVAPRPVMGAMQNELRRSSARVILEGEPAPLAAYLQQRRAQGTRVNLNHLGEAILGEEEAAHRLQAILGHLRNPLVDYISVKISAIFSQISVLDWDRTLSAIKDRLRVLYREAKPAAKFVNLDMEEYRDLRLTLAAFQDVLMEPEFLTLSAGIVLQGYLPDAWPAQQALTEWARHRLAAGGAAIKLRIVKGANLAMEHVEAELHGWNAAPYDTKAETDANYRRMVEFGCRPENAAAVRLGVASHNLFDVALAMVLREENGVADRVELEMLEGMANHQARVVQAKAGGLLVYAPAVGRADFLSALAYLVRRLDENTSPENFLHDMFDLQPDSPAWGRQQDRFAQGWRSRHAVSSESKRGRPKLFAAGTFHNAPDTDWTQVARRKALHAAIRNWEKPDVPAAEALPSVDTVLRRAEAAQGAWQGLGAGKRAAILRKAGEVMAASRFNTIAQMMHEAKKSAPEADVEVSEAIDFAKYAAELLEDAADRTPLGIVVVTPPWNFPYAIPCGNVVHALAAGNSVVLKPAPETAGVALHLARHLWEAGVPEDALQFYPCPDGDWGKQLLSDSRVAAVVLTGAYETARMFQDWRPSLRLYAETSGKNAIVITAQADRDLAIKDVVKSAFGHSGQKCSAASLAILEAEVYDDPQFRRALRDAAASHRVGPSTDLGSVVTPLIGEPSEKLRRALTTLDPGEAWLLEPRVDAADLCLWSPGIKLGVKPGAWFHQTECFGPVLGLMRAETLDEAITFQNGTPFGLTGGIHSLDEREIETWKARVQVGNAYVNRPITGAIVRRQPFGGWKRSAIGPGAKMGGPNYLGLFMKPDPAGGFDDFERVWAERFMTGQDPSALKCESNVLRYTPRSGVTLRISRTDVRGLELAQKAAALSGTPLKVSLIEEEPETAFAGRLAGGRGVLRTTAVPGDAVLRAAYAAEMNWICAPISSRGEEELPRWVQEQSVSTTLHRYGMLASQGSTATGSTTTR